MTFTGFVPPSDIPLYLAAADMLVMPTTPDLAYAAYTSPLKLFEYMASGRPIVASGLASVREVLDDGGNAVLYEANSAEGLAEAVGASSRADARSFAGRARAAGRRPVRVGRTRTTDHQPDRLARRGRRRDSASRA